MAKVYIADLEDAALDWAVATAEGYQAVYTNGSITPVFKPREPVVALNTLRYSSDRSLSGRIIERELIWTRPTEDETDPNRQWRAEKPRTAVQFGATPLIACMRCFVAMRSKEDWIDIPDELIETTKYTESQRG